MTEVYDLSDPAKPVKIRDFGLVGQQPGSTGEPPVNLHGMISTGPQGNRIYFGYGTNTGGVVQIIDREKLLNGPKEPTPENLMYPEVSRISLSSMNGAHTTFPLLKMAIPEFANDKVGNARDMLMIVDEQILNRVHGAAADRVLRRHHRGETADDRVEFLGAGKERRLLRPWRTVRRALLEREHGAGVQSEARVHHLLQCRRPRGRHPQSLSAARGRLLYSGHHGSHRQALHQGRRPGQCKIAIQSNNVETDDRGYIYVVDRANTGVHILEVTGEARSIAGLPN